MPEYRFDEIAILRNEKRTPVPEDKYTYVGLEHLDSGKLEVTRWGSEVDIKGEKLVMHKGDILFGRRNTYLKRAAIAPHDGLFSAHGMIFRPNTKVISERLFPFFIASDYFMDAAIRISVGSLSPTVNWKTLRELKFKLPPLEQQNELADLMQAANDTKVAYEQILLQIDELVKSQFIELFGDPETNPFGWRMGTIRDIVSDVRYGSSRKASIDGKYPYLRMNNITYGGELDLTDVKRIDIPDDEIDRCSVRKGDVLFNRTNSKELVGKTCLYDREELMVLAGFVIRVRVNEKAIPEFLAQYMNLPYIKELLLSMCKAACGQANINAQELQSIPIYIPPVEAQKQFVGFKEQLDKSKFELKQAIERVTNLMKSLMQQDFAN